MKPSVLAVPRAIACDPWFAPSTKASSHCSEDQEYSSPVVWELKLLEYDEYTRVMPSFRPLPRMTLLSPMPTVSSVHSPLAEDIERPSARRVEKTEEWIFVFMASGDFGRGLVAEFFFIGF